MTTTPKDEHQQAGYDVNSQQHTITSKQWKQEEYDDFYTMKKQNVATVLSPLSSNASSPPTEILLQSTDNTQPLLSSPPTPSIPKAIQIASNKSIPSPPPSALTKVMDNNSPNFRKQKSPSPYAFEHSGLTTNMTRDQIKYCGAMIRNLKKHRDATPFIHPVDYIKLNLPDYPQIIKSPMDLTTIDRKFRQKEYMEVEQFINDIRLLFNNCYKYNGPEAIVSVLCQNVESAFEKSLRQMPLSKKDTGSSLTTNSPNTRHESSSLQAITPVFRRRSDRPMSTPPPSRYSNSMATNAKSTTPSTSSQGKRRTSHDLNMNKRRKTEAQLKFCGQAIRELKKNKYQAINYPFLYPVDAVALNIPDYHTIITHPMDISTIERNLANGIYSSAGDVESDVRLMFNNCYRYNPSTLPIHKMAKELEMVFDEKWKKLPNPTTSPSNRKTSPALHDGDNESDDDQITKLEARIASIAQEIESIKSTKKKPSSPSPTVGTKRKTPNTTTTTTTTTTKRGRPSTAKQKSRASTQHPYTTNTKLPSLTFNQKKDLSESINNLTGDKLNTVVNIIQGSMPNLNGQGQDEIVLDIDALDRATLHQLHEFITGKSLLGKQHQQTYKKQKAMNNDQRLQVLEESLRRINERTHSSSDSESSGSESGDDFGSD